MTTPEQVFQAFERAVKYAMRLPAAGPAGISNPWPAILRLGFEGYVQNDKTSLPLTAAELKEFETTSSWISFLKNESDRRLLWAFAAGMPGWKIAKACRPKVSQSTLSRRLLWALGFISYKLDVGETPPAFELQE